MLADLLEGYLFWLGGLVGRDVGKSEEHLPSACQRRGDGNINECWKSNSRQQNARMPLTLLARRRRSSRNLNQNRKETTIVMNMKQGYSISLPYFDVEEKETRREKHVGIPRSDKATRQSHEQRRKEDRRETRTGYHLHVCLSKTREGKMSKKYNRTKHSSQR